MEKMQGVELMARQRCKIFPIREGEEESNPNRYLGQATTDIDKLRRYYLVHRNSNFAVVCGGEIAALFVQGRDAWSRLQERINGRLKGLRTITTGCGNDRYFYFKAVDCTVPAGKTQIVAGVTLLGAGQFVLCPGSVTLAGEHGFARNRRADQVGLVDLPEWLLRCTFGTKEAIDAEIKRLANLSKVDYERERNDAAQRLNFRKSALDALVEETHGRPQVATSRELKPWSEPVDGVRLLSGLYKMIRQHVVLKKEEAAASALWIVQTHALEAFDISPRLAIESVVKQCGKSTFMDVLSWLARNPVTASNISAPALFRLIDQDCPTVFIDEADTFLTKDDVLRGIINSGHRRSTASIIRADGEARQPRNFSTWASVAIACIGSLPETIEDRSILIKMRRKLPQENVEPFRNDRTESCVTLARMAARWSVDHMQQLKAADPKMPQGLDGREADNWRSLLAIADAAGGNWSEGSRRVAELMVRQHRKTDQSVKTNLLRDIRTIFAAQSVDRTSSAGLVTELNKLEGHLWSEWRGNQSITQNAIARLLADFDIAPKEMRINGKNLRGYGRAQFADAFARYLQG
jgi:hypothetical protein